MQHRKDVSHRLTLALTIDGYSAEKVESLISPFGGKIVGTRPHPNAPDECIEVEIELPNHESAVKAMQALGYLQATDADVDSHAEMAQA